MNTFRSGRNLALVAIVMAVVQIAFYAAMAVTSFLSLFDVSWITPTVIISSAPWSTLTVVAYVIAFIFFLRWVHRAVSNLDALGTPNIRSSPSQAVWGFFIPFINLVRPYEVLKQIWVDSQPVVANENGSAIPRSARVVTAWWVLIWIANIATRIMSATLRTPTTHEELQTLIAEMFVVALAWTVAGILFVRMVWLSQRRQEDQWQDLELRRQAPQPTAEALR